MDTLKIIREKIKTLSSIVPGNGLQAVVRHVEMAEAHFSRARTDRDDDLFTDVVYRNNHAFEGILREAYAILAQQDPKNKTAYEIEQYLADNNIFRPRIMELFKNYRMQWRNPSTHEYQLTFTEGEAFLSILSISSFVSILLDQMIEKAAFDIEKSSAERKAPEVREGIQNFGAMPLLDRVSYSLAAFAKEMRQHGPESPDPTESQVRGMLRAFINSVMPEVTVEAEPVLQDDSGNLRPDFVLAQGSERIVLEVYRYGRTSVKIRQRKQQQMLRYLKAAKLSSGIIFVYPFGTEHVPQKYDHVVAEHLDPEHMIVWVQPRPASRE